jgi:hypothetical protein
MRDLSSYVAIGVLVVAIVIALAAHSAKSGRSQDPRPLNWIGLGGTMAIVYITAAHQHRAFWKEKRFWGGLGIALALELGVGVVALWNAPLIKALWWGLVIYPLNTIAVSEFLNRWLATSSPSQAA